MHLLLAFWDQDAGMQLKATHLTLKLSVNSPVFILITQSYSARHVSEKLNMKGKILKVEAEQANGFKNNISIHACMEQSEMSQHSSLNMSSQYPENPKYISMKSSSTNEYSVFKIHNASFSVQKTSLFCICSHFPKPYPKIFHIFLIK